MRCNSPTIYKRGAPTRGFTFPTRVCVRALEQIHRGTLAWSTAIRSRLNLLLGQALHLRPGLSPQPAAVRLLGAGDVQLYCSNSQVEPIEDTSENECSPRPIYLNATPLTRHMLSCSLTYPSHPASAGFPALLKKNRSYSEPPRFVSPLPDPLHTLQQGRITGDGC